MALKKILVENSGNPVEISASELLRKAIQKRDELDVFIRLLLKSMQGRESNDAKKDSNE